MTDVILIGCTLEQRCVRHCVIQCALIALHSPPLALILTLVTTLSSLVSLFPQVPKSILTAILGLSLFFSTDPTSAHLTNLPHPPFPPILRHATAGPPSPS